MRSIFSAFPGGPVTRTPSRPVIAPPSVIQKNPAVACLSLARRVRALAPFELRAQIVIRELLLGDDVSEFLSGDMNDPILNAKNVIGIVVQAVLFQERIEVRELPAVEQDHGFAM